MNPVTYVDILRLTLPKCLAHPRRPLSTSASCFYRLINQSCKFGPNRGYVRSLVCERVKTMRYADAVAAWEEDDGTYILRDTKDVGRLSAR